MQRQDREMTGRQRALGRCDGRLAEAGASAESLRGEHAALQAAVVNELKVRPAAADGAMN